MDESRIGRAPNLVMSQWFRKLLGELDAELDSRAACGGRFDLPWSGLRPGDTEPWPEQQEKMRAICTHCPVIQKCAMRGMRSEGGFYAGVWYPWASYSMTERDKTNRDRARRRLENVARGLNDLDTSRGRVHNLRRRAHLRRVSSK